MTKKVGVKIPTDSDEQIARIGDYEINTYIYDDENEEKTIVIVHLESDISLHDVFQFW